MKALLAGALLILGCTSHTTPVAAPVEARDLKPAPIMRVLPTPAVRTIHRASRHRHSPASLPTVLLRIRSCESGPNGYASHGWAFDADYTATNPRSTASGAWQFLDGTFRTVTGLRGRAKDYSRAVQDAAALTLWRQQGTAPWSASAGCWSR